MTDNSPTTHPSSSWPRPARRSRRRWPLAAVALTWLLIALISLPSLERVHAQDSLPAADWERTGLAAPVTSLIGTPGGALFAITSDGVLRSDDDADTWTRIQVPDDLRELIADPVDPAVLYAWSKTGLSKSEDSAATWRPIFPRDPPSSGSFSAKITASPADNHLLYLAVIYNSSTSSGSYTLYRSADGGESWDEIGKGGPGQSCSYEFPILQAHPTDVNRVFRASACTAARDFQSGLPLRESTDRGATWTELFNEKGRFPQQIVGGRGAEPDRFYLLTVSRSVEAADTSTTLFRSDGGGAWTAKRRWCCADSGPVSLVSVPDRPDHVYVIPARGGIKVSLDGGDTWTDAGERGLIDVRGMTLRPDGASLYAATGRGVFRLRLAPT